MPLDIVYVNSEHRVVSIKKLGCIHTISGVFQSAYLDEVRPRQATPLSRMGVPSELPASSAIELPEGSFSSPACCCML